MSLILVIDTCHVLFICVALMLQYEWCASGAPLVRLWCASGAEHAAHASYPYMYP